MVHERVRTQTPRSAAVARNTLPLRTPDRPCRVPDDGRHQRHPISRRQREGRLPGRVERPRRSGVNRRTHDRSSRFFGGQSNRHNRPPEEGWNQDDGRAARGFQRQSQVRLHRRAGPYPHRATGSSAMIYLDSVAPLMIRLPIAALFAAVAAMAASPVTTSPTFNKDVLPVLQKNCQGCHRPGEAGPMSFLTYKDTRPWAEAISEAVLLRKMPPWFADPVHGNFQNDRRLSQDDIVTLTKWAHAG